MVLHNIETLEAGDETPLSLCKHRLPALLVALNVLVPSWEIQTTVVTGSALVDNAVVFEVDGFLLVLDGLGKGRPRGLG